MPLEPGAEKTTGKSLSVLSDRHLGNIADYGGRYAAAESGANVTSAHVLTSVSYVTVATRLYQAYAAITGLGWTVTTASTNDVYNIWGGITVDPGGDSYQLVFSLYVDGVLYDTQNVGIASSSGGWETVPYFNSLTNLSPGTHTFTFQGWVNTGNLTIKTDTRFTCQRIY